MLACFRINCQTTLLVVIFAPLGQLLVPQQSFADCPLIPPANPWVALECSAKTSQAQILSDSRRPYDLGRPTFVITHGMGGTKPGDRFHQLADAVCQAVPNCNVLIIDWSKQSWRTIWFGLPDPLAVARNIDPVAKEVAELLKTLQVDPTQTTFIGESFGNCVNAQIAKTLGGRGRILALNPANEAGGYKTPDLRACSDVAWSFHTYSMFDTQHSVADAAIFLETPTSATDKDRHIAGASWLTERVKSGDLAWLLTLHNIPGHQAEHFDAIGTLSGEILHQYVPRQRPVPAKMNSSEMNSSEMNSSEMNSSEMNSAPAETMLASTAGSGIQD